MVPAPAVDVVDRLKEPLMAALRQRQEPLAFISNREVFGDLINDQRFVDAYSAALDDLHSGGARAALEALGTRNPGRPRRG